MLPANSKTLVVLFSTNHRNHSIIN